MCVVYRGPCFPLDEASTHTHGPAHDQPGAIFHGILLPSAHATPRQNARRRRDASFYLSAIYLPTRSLPNRPRRAHDPAGDRFEKLLIVPFLEGARHILSSCHLEGRTPRLVFASIGRREGSSRRCESMGGDTKDESRGRRAASSVPSRIEIIEEN